MDTISELNQIQNKIFSLNSDLNRIVEELVQTTSNTYTNISQKYREIRKSTPSVWDLELNQELISAVRKKSEFTKRNDLMNGKWKLLDIGSGSGRDLLYFKKYKDISPIAIENSEGFLKILNEYVSEGLLEDNSIFNNDMRNLKSIETSSIHCVRNHATLHHLPFLFNGVGMDEAIFESYRVLKKNGILYILTKYGDSAKMVDTGEGLGSRFFQFLTANQLKSLVSKYGFSVNKCEVIEESRGEKIVKWVHLIAEKV